MKVSMGQFINPGNEIFAKEINAEFIGGIFGV